MADREPRRRKKRKDSVKKDEHHIDEASTLSFHKVEQRDSDQDAEDELPPPPSHQPSKLAQIVFMVFFLALAALMGSVFIALHGSSSHIQSFNGVEEHIEIQPLSDINSDHVDLHEEEEEEDHQEEILSDLLEKFQELARDFTGDTVEKIADGDDDDEEETVDSAPIDIQLSEEDYSENKIVPPDEVSNDSGVDASNLPYDDDNEEDDDNNSIEEEIVPELTETMTTSAVPNLISEESSSIVGETVLDYEEEEEIVENLAETPKIEEPEEDLEVFKGDEYENADITNEADYIIKDQLDDIDKIVDNNNLFDDDDDDDVDPEDEFDFWQF